MKRTAGLTLLEVVVIVCIVMFLMFVVIALFLPARPLAREEARRKQCSSNLGQIVKACVTYQEPNGGFFPAHSQYTSGDTDVFLPMPSLAILYPGFIDNVKVFRCPVTQDHPTVVTQYDGASRVVSFTADDADPATYDTPAKVRALVGSSIATDGKCSYFYDERSNPGTVGPSQAMACDADGMFWRDAKGKTPSYPVNWYRSPRKHNHTGKGDGMNVMYYDGHVRLSDSPYASDDPKDNIFCPNGGSADGSGQWGADTDAYLWDGVNARQTQPD